jgi:hypothetical protein
MPQKFELYVTTVEQEAYDLAGQLILPPHQVRSHVEHRTDKNGHPFYVVVVRSLEAWDRALAVRQRMFGS